ncbi:hypothetical protein D3C86_1398510 [compost metagenome]
MWTTASIPVKAALSAGGSIRSACRIAWQRSARSGTLRGLRTTPTTFAPRARSTSTTYPPKNPLAPVTAIDLPFNSILGVLSLEAVIVSEPP